MFTDALTLLARPRRTFSTKECIIAGSTAIAAILAKFEATKTASGVGFLRLPAL